MNIKKIFIAFMLLIISVCIPFFTFTAESTGYSNIMLNGKKLNSYILPVTIKGQLMVPLRKVCDIVGIKVSWCKDAKKITCTKGVSKIELLTCGKDILVNGAVATLDAPTILLDNKAHVPVSFPWKEFGVKLSWDKAQKTFSIKTGPVVFFGDSITQGFSLKKYFPSSNAVNKGVSGNTTQDAIERLNDIIKLKPAKIFVMLGTNDIWQNTDKITTIDNYKFIIETIQAECPYSSIIVQSILPLGQAALDRNKLASNVKVNDLNSGLKTISQDYNLRFVDIGKLYKGSDGILNNRYTSDGVHLKSTYYSIWANSIRTLVINPS